ncbi:class I SAM-dependent methyltransferase [Streptomyces sp. NPDC002855]|uniref:class I SAM-dependent methyltransferase n=1 Tax=Streptomyces sp. NPDC002855 TaxID=3154437 RepID=UPI00331D944D
MADEAYENPRLAALYDPLDADRGDLDVYADVAAELKARQVLDVGCGTGTFALLLADRGLRVTGVEPAAASLDVARSKPGSERVRWLHGDATALPDMRVDLATMTANVAQAIVDPEAWEGTLHGIHAALRPGGHLVFETRDPARRAWREWNRAATRRTVAVEGVGDVETWLDITDVSLPLVSFRSTVVLGQPTEFADLLKHGHRRVGIPRRDVEIPEELPYGSVVDPGGKRPFPDWERAGC